MKKGKLSLCNWETDELCKHGRLGRTCREYNYNFVTQAVSSFLSQASNFQSIETLSDFLTSQERQEIILHLLNTIRAEKGDSIEKERSASEAEGNTQQQQQKKKKRKTLHFREGEAIGKTNDCRPQCILLIRTYHPLNIAKYVLRMRDNKFHLASS